MSSSIAEQKNKIAQQVAFACGRNKALLTSSGSAALITALKAANIPAGSDVIMPAICCPAVLFAIQMAGFSPILADVALDDFSMNVPQLKSAKTSNTKAVVAVHGYGHYCQIDQISEYCLQNNLVLIEDACLAMGGTFKGKKLGSFGDISIMSFGYDKVLACNYGGALLTNNNEYQQSAQQFLDANHFFSYQDSEQLLTSLNDELQRLDEYVAKRKENAALCNQLLTSENVLKPSYSEELLFWRYPLLVKSNGVKGNRNHLIASAKSQGILITSHYKSLQLLKTEGYLANAQQISDQVLNIFIRPETPKQQIINTINFINEHA